MPARMRRELFEAFHLEIRRDREVNRVSCRITLARPVLNIQRRVVQNALEHTDELESEDKAHIA